MTKLNSQTGTSGEKMKKGVTTKNGYFKVSFSCLCTGELQHETYAVISAGQTCYAGTRTLSEFEGVSLSLRVK